MHGINVVGRGFKKATVAVNQQGEGVMLRIEDEDNPEAWVHVHISEDAVWELHKLFIAPPLILPPVPEGLLLPFPEIDLTDLDPPK